MSRVARTFDRIAYTLSPRWGSGRINARRRQEFSDKMAEVTRLKIERKRREYASGGGFASAENSHNQYSWLGSKLSPDSSLEMDRPLMIERADSAYKNYELGTSHVEGRVIRVAGCGFSVQPELDPEDLGIGEEEAEEQNRMLRKGWDRLVMRLGKHGEWLYEIQQLLVRYWERRGEFFVLFGDSYDPLSPVSLKVEVIHPDRVSTPPNKEADPLIRMGIQLDADGCGVGAYIRDAHPGDSLDVKESWTYYPFTLSNGLPRLLHHFDRRDEGQHRGYPRMQVGTKGLKDMEEYGEAETERNYVGSCMAAFVRSDLAAEDVMATHGVVEDSSGRRLRDIQPSMIHYIGPNDEVQFSNPTGAPASFTGFMEHKGRTFSAGAGTPYEMLTGNWGNLAYNAARIIWNTDEAAVDVLQMGHFKAVLAIYQHYVTRMISSGQLEVDPVAYRAEPWLYWSVRVIPPARASIDPSREDRNDLVNVESCIEPHSDVVERKTGEPAEKIYRRIQRNRKVMEKYELEVHMPNMGRDEDGKNSSTMPGDTNQESSDANSDKQAVGA